MKVSIAAALLALTAGLIVAPAFAQDKGPSAMEIELDRRKRAAEEADRGYRVIMRNTTPEKETKTDPWANARTPATESKK